MEIKSVNVRYSTSKEKWEGIREFAVANGLEVKYIDAMIARIEEKGDAVISEATHPQVSGDCYMLFIGDMMDYMDSVYSDFLHPCFHCFKYRSCTKCPLYDDSGGCCAEWRAAKDEAVRVDRMYGGEQS